MKNYLDLLQNILDNGQHYGDRTKTGRISLFGTQLRFDLTKGFPLVTTKKVFTRGIIEELLWFLRGSENATELVDKNVHIWDGWMVTQELLDNPPERIKEASGYNTHTKDGGILTSSEFFADAGITPGHIGPMYGSVMRNAGYNDGAQQDALFGDKAIDVKIKELASDKLRTAVTENMDNPAAQMDVANSMTYDIDQMQQLILNLKRNPHSSRHVVSHWIPEFLPDERLTPQENVLLGKQALAPCHVLHQYYCTRMTHEERYNKAVEMGYISKKQEPGSEYLSFTTDTELDLWKIPQFKLSMMMTQRSLDLCLGGPFNIASYSLLLMMVAQCVNMVPFEFIWSAGDAHVYFNQVEMAKEQLKREPRALPTMKINPAKTDLFSFTIDDFTLEGYTPHDKLDMPVSI